MATAVKFQRRSEPNDGGDIPLGRRLGAFLFGYVEVIDVSSVMFAERIGRHLFILDMADTANRHHCRQGRIRDQEVVV